MDQASWGNVIAIVFLLAIAAILIVIIWQVFATRRATASLLREDEFRKLAERGIAAEEHIAKELAAASTELVDLRARVAEIERMMKEVG